MTPQDKKYITYGVGGIAAILLLSAIFKKKNDPSNSTYDPTGNGSVTNANNSVFNAKKIADELYNLLRRTGGSSFLNPGQTEEVFSLLRTVSQNQFGQLMTAFGKRAYNKFSANDLFLLWQTPTYYPLDIILKNELSTDDYNDLKQKYPNYL
ncbi:hypothetical protein [Flavobacterium capsici]|uniref:Uncharacterized protein n=1 Tax=Flavobacterium capsici TaxID=3075618 RepID=A0AA96EV79_9FLAO|nr:MULTISPECIES: hypothetical protein [unclassified Flavobacterium]WNM19279.1 hypothetical protein RN608_01020 [Flavobacterium sp. PMR2A8]WNM20668.1 hypothetical protein RN605_08190 [Flavobacterium sp. PMTSA4]